MMCHSCHPLNHSLLTSHPHQKASPGDVPSPPSASFPCQDNAEWEANNLIGTHYSNADSTVPMKVNLFNFVEEIPEKYLQQVLERDKRLSLRPDLTAPTCQRIPDVFLTQRLSLMWSHKVGLSVRYIVALQYLLPSKPFLHDFD